MGVQNRRVAFLYLTAVTACFLIGGLLGMFMRVELTTPQENFISSDTYGRLFSMHGILMVFFVLIPAIPAVLGSLLVPRMIGSRQLAFPRLAFVSWLLFAGGVVMVLAALLRGGVIAGWTFYSGQYGESDIGPVVVGVILAFSGMILLAINLISTSHTMRTENRTWSKLPLLVWSLYLTSWMILIAAPILLACLILLLLEQLFGVGIFEPSLGGDPLLLKRLFWFFGRPALFVMILPAIGVVSELLGGQQIYGRKNIMYSMVAIAFLSFLTSGGHFVVSSQSLETTLLSSLFNFVTAIPFVIIFLSWVLTLYRGVASYSASMLYGLGFIVLVSVGGLSGLVLAASGLTVHLHSTYFVLAHFHYLLAGAALMAYLGGLHFWWHEFSGRRYPDSLGQVSAVLIFCGVNLTFLPQFILGFLGMPRRYSAYPVEFEAFQVFSTAGIPILALGYLLPMAYLGWGLIRNSRGEI